MYKKSLIKISLAFLLVCLFYSCTSDSTVSSNSYLSIKDNAFADNEGRTVILNGLNHVTKVPEDCYLYKDDEALFRKFKEWGFNCVRYGIYWDGLEPEPGKINEEYLKEIDKRVKWAEENGIWLILDMHQDLYSRKFGNGAPMWATLDDNLPHETGDVWSDAYLVSPALHKAFDNFWNNTPASDGIGLQDHYIFVWKTIAKRYANSPSVAGFDIMNEPFMGSDGQKVLPKLLEGYAIGLTQSTGQEVTESELVEMWGNEAKRIEALSKLTDKKEYAAILDNAFETVKIFEQGALSSFYQKVRDAIRSVDQKHIIFLEHTYFCNLGIKSSFHIPKDEKGEVDKLCAYAPHGYDLVTDTHAATEPCYARIDLIFERIFTAGKEKNVPVIIGEWGAFYMGKDYLQPAAYQINLFEKALSGQTYWSYWENIEQQDYFFGNISRYYPMAINGKLMSYSNHHLEKKFYCEWIENTSNTPSVIYIPDLTKLGENLENVELTPKSDLKIIPIINSKAGYLEIAPKGEKRHLVLIL